MKLTCVTFILVLCFCSGNAYGRSYKCNNITDGFELSTGDDGGQCVNYVRKETGIEWACCHGDAKSCLGQAQNCGYSTGSVPISGSIMVMDGWIGNMAGHVAIVVAVDKENPSLVKVRDSNWSDDFDEEVREHWIDTDKYTVKGYVSCEKASNSFRFTPQKVINRCKAKLEGNLSKHGLQLDKWQNMIFYNEGAPSVTILCRSLGGEKGILAAYDEDTAVFINTVPKDQQAFRKNKAGLIKEIDDEAFVPTARDMLSQALETTKELPIF